MRKTGIVVPCYNESKRLDFKSFISTIENEPNLSFLFVDDGSTDATIKVLNAIKEKCGAQVDILRLDQNCGKAEAVRRGILELIDGPFDYVGYWDADLATPLDAIQTFCTLLDSTDNTIVIGSRVKLLGRNIARKAARHYFGRIFASCASLLLSIDVYDTQCGAKLFRNSPPLKKVFARPFKVNWTFDVEMLARFPIVLGRTPSAVSSHWYEYPLKEWIDVEGSKVKFLDFIISSFEFCTLFTYLHTPARKLYSRYLIDPD